MIPLIVPRWPNAWFAICCLLSRVKLAANLSTALPIATVQLARGYQGKSHDAMAIPILIPRPLKFD